jgi:hypothetical protein
VEDPHVRLKDALRARRWTVYRTFCREYDKAAKILDPALVGSYPSRAQLFRWMKGDVKKLPYPDHCRVLEKMFPEWTVEQLFEPCSAPCPYGGESLAADSFTSELTRSVKAGLANPDADGSSWGRRPPGSGRPTSARATTDLRTTPLPELLARKVADLGHILRLPPDEAAEIAALAGNLVDLMLSIDLLIQADGICSVTYRYHSLNLTERPVHRAPRDLWFQHSRSKLELVALREGPTRNAIQRLHTADNIAKFACQLSPPIQPGETATFGYTCSGAEFRQDFYWRQAFARYTRQYTLRVRHEGLKECMGITATEELPDGTETMAQESVSWDYDGDDVVMTFTRDHLQPNQYATLRWEPA